MADKRYDALVVGAGPAGLSAAIYLGRFLRKTLVIDSGAGRWNGPQVNENYLGFPNGVTATRLQQLGRRQAERFGVEFVEGYVTNAAGQGGGFVLTGSFGERVGRTVILAMGVTDIWPSFPNVERYIGRSLYWCITCDGFRTRGKRTLLVGADDEAAVTACQFLRYTDKLTFVCASVGGEVTIAPEKLESLRDQGIELVEGNIERVSGAGGKLRSVQIAGRTHEADLMFSLLGHVPNSTLAAQLGVLLDEGGYVRIDSEQHTNVPCVYAAGDVSGPYAHQVTSAVHEGATAAQAANFDLYDDYQQE